MAAINQSYLVLLQGIEPWTSASQPVAQGNAVSGGLLSELIGVKLYRLLKAALLEEQLKSMAMWSKWAPCTG
jgi:hypothetical protein